MDELKKEETTQVEALSDDLLDQVSGGGAFDDVPRVKEHDYTKDITSRI